MKKRGNQSGQVQRIETLTEKYYAGELSTEQYVKKIRESREGDTERRKIEKRLGAIVFS